MTLDTAIRTSAGRIVIWSLCLLFVARLAFGSFGGVLCIADSGHVKVESACRPCIADAANSCIVAQPVTQHEHDNDCASCLDLPLLQDVLSQRPVVRHNSTTLFNSQTSILPINSPLIEVLTCTGELFGAAPAAPVVQSMLSTTVLRC